MANMNGHLAQWYKSRHVILRSRVRVQLLMLAPGACIIKHISAVINGFRNKLEHLYLNTRLGWKGLPGTNTLAVNYGRNKFYDTGPWRVKNVEFLKILNICWNTKNFLLLRDIWPPSYKPFKGRNL